jgi:hypothetical protein
MKRDFLDEIIDKRTRGNPRFPDLVKEANRRRKITRMLATNHESKEVGTAASVVSKLKTGGDLNS